MDASKNKGNLGSGRIAVRLLGYLKPYWRLALLCMLFQGGMRATFLVFPWMEGQFFDRVIGEKECWFSANSCWVMDGCCGHHLSHIDWMDVFFGEGHGSNPS